MNGATASASAQNGRLRQAGDGAARAALGLLDVLAQTLGSRRLTFSRFGVSLRGSPDLLAGAAHARVRRGIEVCSNTRLSDFAASQRSWEGPADEALECLDAVKALFGSVRARG